MSLLNQYLKTIAKKDAHKESSEPLPSLLKVRQNENVKGRRVCNAMLLILVIILAGGLITWRYSHRKPDKPMASGVAQAGTGSIANSIQKGDPKEMKTSAPTTSAAAVSPAVSAQNFQLSHERMPEPGLATPSVPPPHTMGRAVATPPRTHMPISSPGKKGPVPMFSEKVPNSQSSPSQQPEPLHKSVPPLVTTILKKSKLKDPSFEHAQNFYQLGLIALQEGELPDAEHFLRETLKHSPNDINALLNLSNVYIRQERLGLAVQTLKTIRQLDPDSVKSLNNLGYVALQRKNFKEARHYYEEALKRNPVDEVALLNLGYLSQIENNRTEALERYEKIISLHPENENAIINAAHLMTQDGKTNKAIQLYNRSLTIKSVQNNRELAQKIEQRIKVLLAYEFDHEKSY
ncbi:MAG: hypothetical protein SRB2_02556 [Desulfobacteraceae bacterium Eth-SRB2]|nr:MAG: hypothetical protein SRB2_02556 [Desulfobacteraceae bacterium Eth-SRB2]